MAREPKPFVFELTSEEAAELTGAVGSGGHQDLHRMLTDQLQDGKLSVSLDDAQLGKIVRYMTQYKGGGFQSHLRRAFLRPLKLQLGVEGPLL